MQINTIFQILFIVSAILFGYLCGKNALASVISISIFSILGVVHVITDGFLFFQIPIAIGIAIICASLGILIRNRKYVFAGLTFILLLAAILFPFLFIAYDSIQCYLFEPVSSIQTDSTEINKYRFGRTEILRKPSNLREAHLYLDNIFKRKYAKIDSEDPIKYHFGLGMWMRNNWGLWSGESYLFKELEGKGLQPGDDMSGYILETYFIRCALIYRNKYNEKAFYTLTLDTIISLNYDERRKYLNNLRKK
jgi:hypothetical protein